VGIDHLIYGWMFFGVVIGVLFWFGSLWREAAAPSPRRHAFFDAKPTTPAVMACAAIATVVLSAASPLYLPYLDRMEDKPIRLAAPAGVAGWTLEPHQATQWRPQYRGAAASTLGVYRKGEHSVAVYLGYYRNQHQGAELVGSQNLIAGAVGSPWARIGESLRSERLPNGMVELRQTRLGSAGGRLLVWDWYRIAGHDLSNPYLAKALLARDKLLRRGDDSAAIVLAAPYEARPETAAETLRVFTREMQPVIDHALRVAAQKESG
jgi:EpsI family protein